MSATPRAANAAAPWAKYMRDLYSSRKPPHPLGSVRFEEIEAMAKEKLKDYPGSFMYAGGSAGTNSTYNNNLRAFDKYGILPRMLHDSTTRDLNVTLFGKTHPSPLLIAPIGVQGLFHADAEEASARVAAKLGIPYIMSTASSRSIEDVAAASSSASSDAERWYQLYWPIHDDVTLSLLSRAKKNGFSALIVTLDTMTLGWRPHDLELSVLPFIHGLGTQVGRSDPVFCKKMGLEPVHEKPAFPYMASGYDEKLLAGDKEVGAKAKFGMDWLGEANSGKYRSWEDTKFLRDNWDGPLILKGIQTLEDAEKALEHNIDGIIVSNHGGRQVDGAIPSLYALSTILTSPKILAAQKAGKFTVLFDSGIRTGSDIIKALALGAQAVLLGRPWLYGLGAGGEEGMEQVVKHTMADLDVTMGQIGWASVQELQGKRDKVVEKLDF